METYSDQDLSSVSIEIIREPDLAFFSTKRRVQGSSYCRERPGRDRFSVIHNNADWSLEWVLTSIDRSQKFISVELRECGEVTLEKFDSNGSLCFMEHNGIDFLRFRVDRITKVQAEITVHYDKQLIRVKRGESD